MTLQCGKLFDLCFLNNCSPYAGNPTECQKIDCDKNHDPTEFYLCRTCFNYKVVLSKDHLSPAYYIYCDKCGSIRTLRSKFLHMPVNHN